MRPSFNLPEPVEDGLPFRQTFWPETTALSNCSISQVDSSDGFGLYRRALGHQPGSYLTIPSSASSAHTYSYAASSVGSEYVCEQSSPVEVSAARAYQHHRNDSNAGSSSPFWEAWRVPGQSMDYLPGLTGAQDVQEIAQSSSRLLPGYSRSVSSGMLQNTSHHQQDLLTPQADAAGLGVARLSDTYGYAMARRGSANSSRQNVDRAWSRRPRSSSASETLQPHGAALMKRRSSARGSGRKIPSHRMLLSPREPYRDDVDQEPPTPSPTRIISQPPPPVQRGRRNGVMTEKGKADATKKRRNREVCLECKFKRIIVSESRFN